MTVAPSFVELDGGSTAEARVFKKPGKSTTKDRKGKVVSKKAGKKKNRKAKRRRRGRAAGHNVAKSKLSKKALTKPSGRVWVYTENLHEEVKVNIYDDNGDFDDEALAALDHEFRCRRTREERAFDPRLYETLSRLQDHFKGKRIHLVSGFRFQRNEGSRHYHAAAADIRIPGVSIQDIRAFVSTLDHGGMGIGLYPNSNFVHVDFRAPGQPSYRWIDRSRGGGGKGKGRSKRSKRSVPNT